MRIVNTHEAKTHLSRLLDEATNGEEIVIAKAGRPVAKLIAYKPEGRARKLGAWKGKLKIADDFDEFGPELQELFYGSGE